MRCYKIFLNGYESILNVTEGDVEDPYSHPKSDYAFSTGRMAQAVIKSHKKQHVAEGISLEGCIYTVQRGEFVPREEAE